MLKSRIIPALLLQNQGLVKTVCFKNPKYVGDPINAVHIFNEKEVDELVFLDISATPENRQPNFKLVSDIAAECFMPFAYGGGIKEINEMKILFGLGAEKVVVNSYAMENPTFIRAAAEQFGSQSIVVALDVKKSLFGKYEIFIRCGTVNTHKDPVEYSIAMQNNGAGELFVNAIDRDGTQEGYDIELIKRITKAVQIPVIACGGAGRIADLAAAISVGGASAAAAGSFFVFHGKHRAVLISYPDAVDIERLLSSP